MDNQTELKTPIMTRRSFLQALKNTFKGAGLAAAVGSLPAFSQEGIWSILAGLNRQDASKHDFHTIPEQERDNLWDEFFNHNPRLIPKEAWPPTHNTIQRIASSFYDHEKPQTSFPEYYKNFLTRLQKGAENIGVNFELTILMLRFTPFAAKEFLSDSIVGTAQSVLGAYAKNVDALPWLNELFSHTIATPFESIRTVGNLSVGIFDMHSFVIAQSLREQPRIWDALSQTYPELHQAYTRLLVSHERLETERSKLEQEVLSYVATNDSHLKKLFFDDPSNQAFHELGFGPETFSKWIKYTVNQGWRINVEHFVNQQPPYSETRAIQATIQFFKDHPDGVKTLILDQIMNGDLIKVLKKHATSPEERQQLQKLAQCRENYLAHSDKCIEADRKAVFHSGGLETNSTFEIITALTLVKHYQDMVERKLGTINFANPDSVWFGLLNMMSLREVVNVRQTVKTFAWTRADNQFLNKEYMLNTLKQFFDLMKESRKIDPYTNFRQLLSEIDELQQGLKRERTGDSLSSDPLQRLYSDEVMGAVYSGLAFAVKNMPLNSQ